MMHKNPNFRMYMGDMRDGLYPAPKPEAPWAPQQALLEVPAFAHFKKCMMLEELVCARQVHRADGIHVTRAKPETLTSFTQDADFLITSDRRIGIGVLTADCVPLVMHDAMQNVIAVVHAGWRGSVQEVSIAALKALIQTFDAQLHGLRIFIGPSAGVCCYRVDEPFIEAVRLRSYADTALVKRNGEWFFDLPLFNRLQLERAGVPKEAFRMQYNACTMCSPHFFSYRRQKEQSGRQITIISLV